MLNTLVGLNIKWKPYNGSLKNYYGWSFHTSGCVMDCLKNIMKYNFYAYITKTLFFIQDERDFLFFEYKLKLVKLWKPPFFTYIIWII